MFRCWASVSGQFEAGNLKISSNAILGVISTQPGLLLGGHDPEEFKEEINQPVALSGRIPVKITNTEQIKIGDKLTLSEVPGIARKAKQGEESIGYSLSNTILENNTILMFVQNDSNQFSNEYTDNLETETQPNQSALEYLTDKITDKITDNIRISTEFFTKRLTAMVGVFDIFRTQTIRVEKGIEQKNPQTNQIECYFIESGEWKTVIGNCDDNEADQRQADPVATPSPEAPLPAEISPIPSPEASPILSSELSPEPTPTLEPLVSESPAQLSSESESAATPPTPLLEETLAPNSQPAIESPQPDTNSSTIDGVIHA